MARKKHGFRKGRSSLDKRIAKIAKKTLIKEAEMKYSVFLDTPSDDVTIFGNVTKAGALFDLSQIVPGGADQGERVGEIIRLHSLGIKGIMRANLDAVGTYVRFILFSAPPGLTATSVWSVLNVQSFLEPVSNLVNHVYFDMVIPLTGLSDEAPGGGTVTTLQQHAINKFINLKNKILKFSSSSSTSVTIETLYLGMCSDEETNGADWISPLVVLKYTDV